MTLDGCKIKEVGVRLLLSSRAEMQKVIETARQQTVSVFQLNTPAPVVHVPPPAAALVPNPQILLAQQMMSQQPPNIPFSSNNMVAQAAAQAAAAAAAAAAANNVPKHDYSTQVMSSILPGQILERNRLSSDKKLVATTNLNRRRDSRSRSRERHSGRGRSRSRDRSTSRDRSRRNRSRSRSRDRTYRGRNRDKRSYSRDEYDSYDSDSRGSSGRKRSTPPKSVQVWDNQGPENFRAMVYNNGNSNDSGTGRNNNNLSRQSGGDSAPESNISKNAGAFGAFQRLRERRNESTNPDQKPMEEENAIDLTEDDHNCCVKVSNIEKTTGYGELRRFFQGLPVRQNGLKMINDNMGKRTGVAYVRFHRPESRKFAIMRSGQVLHGAKLVVNTLDDNEFEEAVDSYRPPITINSSQQINKAAINNTNSNNINNGVVGAVNPQPTPLAFDQIVFTCLKITDVPSLCTEQDIMKVFSEYGLMHIIITKDKQKRHCAFIKLNRAEDAKRVLKEKNLFTMAHKNVTVTMCSEAVFEEVMNATSIEETSGYGSQDETITTTTSNSVSTTEEEKRSEMATANNNKKEKKASGSRWGEKVQGATVTHIPQSAIVSQPPMMDKKPLPTRWTHEEQHQQQQQIPPNVGLDPILSQLNLALPFLSSLLPQAAAVVKSQESLQIQQQQQQAQPTIVSRDPRLKNMMANNNLLNRSTTNTPGHTYLPANQRQNILNPADPRTRFMNNNVNNNNNNGRRDTETDCVVISNLEPSCTDLDVASFFSKAGIVPMRVHILLSTTGSPSGDAFVEFSSPKDVHAALLQNERLLGKNPVFVETIPRAQVDEVLASFGGGGNNKGPISPAPQVSSFYNQFAATGINPGLLRGANPAQMGGNARPPFMPGMVNPGGMRPMNPPETNVLNLNNVPYRAGVEDIIEFFAGYDIRPQDVMRRFNDQGQPTAEAKVRFKNPEEARKAFEQNKFSKMNGRTIFLEFEN